MGTPEKKLARLDRTLKKGRDAVEASRAHNCKDIETMQKAIAEYDACDAFVGVCRSILDALESRDAEYGATIAQMDGVRNDVRSISESLLIEIAELRKTRDSSVTASVVYGAIDIADSPFAVP